jgi:hypothetical protein
MPPPAGVGQIGRRHVVAHYGWPAIAERMEGLYRSVLMAPAQSGQ